MTCEEIDPSKIETFEDAIAAIRYLLKENAELRRENGDLREEIARLKKDSSTSSKPPSSDIVKPPNERKQKGRRKSGAQPGHPGHTRAMVPLERVDKIDELTLGCCPECGSRELGDENPDTIQVQQVAEFPDLPIIITEYRRHGRFCRCCGIVQYPNLPPNVIPNQLLGPRLLSLLAYMKGGMSVSLSELQRFCTDVLGIVLSEGTITNAIFRASEALKRPYEELGQHLPEVEVLNIDETSWNDSGKKLWVWVFCSPMVAFFAIRASRGCKVLKEILGETFSGAIVSDFLGAYVKYANPAQQFCLAHLIRDIKFLTTLPDPESVKFGETVLRHFKRLFELWHNRSLYDSEYFARRVDRVQRKLFTLLCSNKIPAGKATTMQKRIIKHWDCLFRFLAQQRGIEPTNNLAERTLRPLVKMRRLSQGSRGTNGQLWAARANTVFESCKKQQRNSWNFIQAAVNAHFFGFPTPSLVRNP